MENKTDLEVSQEFGTNFKEVLAKFPDSINSNLSKYSRLIVWLIAFTATLSIAGVAFNLAHVLQRLPIFGSVFELVGLIGSSQFVWQNLRTAEQREKLYLKYLALKAEVLGS